MDTVADAGRRRSTSIATSRRLRQPSDQSSASTHDLNKKSLVSPPVETEHEYSADGETRDDGVDDFMGSSFKCCVDNLLV